MKILQKSILLLTTLALFNACHKDDDASPEPVVEEEVITTVSVSLTPEGGGTAIVLLSKDLDGDGPNDPVVTTSGKLSKSTTYNGSITL